MLKVKVKKTIQLNEKKANKAIYLFLSQKKHLKLFPTL